jgi:DNA polymerase-4
MSTVEASPRDILHLDMDCFFAAVEVREVPSLRNKPVIVGGTENRGVVAAASYEARAFGVHSAMSIREARHRCPGGVFLSPRHGFYQEVSSELMKLCRDMTPLVEPMSLDEAFLDVAGAHSLLGDSEQIATALRTKVRDHLHLACSVGVGRTKLVAKLASRAAKPKVAGPGKRIEQGAGVVVVGASDERAFLDAHLVRAIPGIGPQTSASLERIGVQWMSELATIPLAQLERRFGRSRGKGLYEIARGIDDRKVEADREVRSISQESTFEVDVDDDARLRSTLRAQIEEVMRRCRKSSVVGRTVTLKIRYGDFSTITRSRTERGPFVAAAAAARVAESLFDALDCREGIRLMGVAISNLEPVSERGRQLELFGSDSEEESRVDQRHAGVEVATDEIRRRFGAGSIALGAPPIRPRRQDESAESGENRV